MKQRFLKLITLCIISFVMTCSTASACPNCKAANETDSNLPKAYMYSILFMIGMPATIFAGFGLSFYRMAAKEKEQLEDSDSTVPPPNTGP